ncbi:hypothetical protein PENSPDRAFT_649168 [Peniophora sp. CONT]|nr:hypothetical protein PENSPDRAFT_649168 [Peniophora sp. CONT]
MSDWERGTHDPAFYGQASSGQGFGGGGQGQGFGGQGQGQAGQFGFQQPGQSSLLGDFPPPPPPPDFNSSSFPASASSSAIPTSTPEPARKRRQTDAGVIALPASSSSTPARTKRPLESADEDAEGDMMGGGEGERGEGETNASMKRACARCKSLKVRCQFKRDADTCERCLRAAHECVIPGKKQRKPPAKRETFISVIRDQADLIERLLSHVHAHTDDPQRASQLERDAISISQAAARTAATLNRPPLTAAAASASASTSTLATSASNVTVKGELDAIASASTPELSSELQAWLGAAPTELGGASARSYFADAGPEDSSSSSDEEDAAEVLPTDTEGETEDPRLGARVVVEREAGYGEDDERYGTPGRKNSKSVGRSDRIVGIPVKASPFGLMARMSTHKVRSRAGSPVREAEGIAGEDFFRAASPQALRPAPLAHEPPAILKDSIVTPALAETLFQSYFTYMNPSVSLLDDALYTPQSTYWRSPFLFTVIVAIASRYSHPDLYPIAMTYARRAAAHSFLSGAKRVEAVQAFILLALYPQPVVKWEDDRCFLFLGHAIRLAVDMNLHHPATARARNEAHARELLNRTRCWLNCFNLDRSMGSQYGKSTIIRNSDWVSVHSGDWWQSSEWNMPHFDIHLCAYNAELRLVADFMMSWLYTDEQHPTGLNRNIDIEAVAAEYDDKIESTRVQWFELLVETDQTVPLNRFRTGLLKLGYSFARLVVLSHGFQHAWRTRDGGVGEEVVSRCIRAATDVVSAMVDDIGRPEQRIYVRMASEAQLVFVAFACSFLIRLLQPRYASLLSPAQRAHTLATVERAIGFADTPEINTDDGRGWSLYARFLARLLADVDGSGSGSSKSKSRQPGSTGSSSPGAANRGGSGSPLGQGAMMASSASPPTQYPPQSSMRYQPGAGPSPSTQYPPGSASSSSPLAQLNMSPAGQRPYGYPTHEEDTNMYTPTARFQPQEYGPGPDPHSGSMGYAQPQPSYPAHPPPAQGYPSYDSPPAHGQWPAHGPPIPVPSQHHLPPPQQQPPQQYYAPMTLTPFNARFDHYAPPSSSGALPPAAPAQSFYGQQQHFGSSLAFDGEFIRSMQSASAGAGQGLMPGFGWMEQVPPQGQPGGQQHQGRQGGGYQ